MARQIARSGTSSRAHFHPPAARFSISLARLRSIAAVLCSPSLLAGGANTGQALRNTGIETDHRRGELIDCSDQSQADGRYDESVLHQVLSLFFLDQTNK